MKKTVANSIKILSTVGVTLLVIFAILVVGVKIFSWDVYIVLSGSMEPKIPTGSIIYVKEPDIDSLQVGDVITFEMAGGKVATHRIDAIEGSGANTQYITKGDANDDRDATPVVPSKIIGQYVWGVPLLGFVVNYIQAPPGTFVAVAVVAILLIFMLIPDLLTGEEEEKKKKSRKKGKDSGDSEDGESESGESKDPDNTESAENTDAPETSEAPEAASSEDAEEK